MLLHVVSHISRLHYNKKKRILVQFSVIQNKVTGNPNRYLYHAVLSPCKFHQVLSIFYPLKLYSLFGLMFSSVQFTMQCFVTQAVGLLSSKDKNRYQYGRRTNFPQLCMDRSYNIVVAVLVLKSVRYAWMMESFAVRRILSFYRGGSRTFI